MLVHSVRRVPPPKSSSSHRISKPPHLYSSTSGATARVTVVSVMRGVGAPTVVSFTVLPTVPKLPSASKGADRKSTRLNSSHSQISYAVFCLKKKKTVLHANTARLCGFCGSLPNGRAVLAHLPNQLVLPDAPTRLLTLRVAKTRHISYESLAD